MIAAAILLFAGTLFSIRPNAPDTPIQIGYDQSVSIAAEGATAAYAIDASIADATIEGNTIRVHGKSAGATAVVIVTASSIVTVRVNVAEPPLVLPAGFQRAGTGISGQAGSAELRYVSDPAEVAATINLERVDPERTQRFRIVTAKPIHANGAHSSAIPFVSYQVVTPRRDVTLFDQSVMNSPLTLDGEYVRGLHVRQGPWSFHGGVTSIALFQNAFFSTAPEYVAGITRNLRLTTDHTLSANAYYFVNAPEERAFATNGAVVSLLDTYRSPKRNLLLRSEIGASQHGIAGSAQLSREEPGLHFAANVRYEPPRFPALAIANLHGLFADADLYRAPNELTSIAATAIVSDYRLPNTHQTNIGASTTVSHKITEHVAAVAGAVYSSFRSSNEGFDLSTFAVPVGFDAAWKRAYFGVRDQPTTDFHGRIANAYNANAGVTLGHVTLSGFYRHDVDLPAVNTIFSAVPGLQETLERSGIFVANTAQLISLLRDVGLLARLGFTSPLDLRFAPVRDDIGGSVGYFGARQRLTLSVFRSNTQLVNGSYRFNTTSLSYTRALLTGAEIAAFVTWQGGAGLRERPVVGFLVREPIASLSRMLPAARGAISGHVFRDDDATATYASSAKGLADVEVALDDARTTRTDANGYYVFRGVSSGVHRLAVRPPSTERFFLTTDSPAYADINSTVNFGVSFVHGAVFGAVMNDAGEGIQGVRVQLDGDTLHRATTTDPDGHFRFNAVPDGTYVVSTAAETFPSGYDLAALAEVRVGVREAQPAEAKLAAKALRSISGTVTTLDPELHKEVAVAGARVALRELGLTTETNAEGKYVLRRVPAGAYTIVAGSRTTRVLVPAQPGIVVAEKLVMTSSPTVVVAEAPAQVASSQPQPPQPQPQPQPSASAAASFDNFHDALAAFERQGGPRTAEERYYYAVALYEIGRYAEAKREFAASHPPDTDIARRYAAKISGAIVWTR